MRTGSWTCERCRERRTGPSDCWVRNLSRAWFLRIAGALLLSGLLFVVPASTAGRERVAEDDLKAVLLYKLLKFVSWPEAALGDPEDSLTVCIAGRDAFQGDFEARVRNRSVSGRGVRVKALGESDGPGAGDVASTCHALFIRASENGNAKRLLEVLRGAAVLTVGETDRFCRNGGMVGLVRRGSRIGFEVNVEAARQAGIGIRSQLVQLATVVSTE